MQKFTLGIAMLSCVLVMLFPMALPVSARVVVIVPPWETSAAVFRVISEAGGSLVNSGRFTWVGVAQGDSGSFVSRLYQSGAVLVLDGSLLSGCFAKEKTQ